MDLRMLASRASLRASYGDHEIMMIMMMNVDSGLFQAMGPPARLGVQESAILVHWAVNLALLTAIIRSHVWLSWVCSLNFVAYLMIRVGLYNDNTFENIGLGKHFVRCEFSTIVDTEEHGRSVCLKTCNCLGPTGLANGLNGLADADRRR